MENESDSYDNVNQDIVSLTESTLPSDIAVPSNSIAPPVSAVPPNSIAPPVSAVPPNSTETPPVASVLPNSNEPLNATEPPAYFIETPVSTTHPASIEPLVSAAPPNSNATVDENTIPYPYAPPEYASIEPPPPYSNPSQYPSTLGIPYLQNQHRGIPGTCRLPHGQHYYPPLGFAQPQGGPKPHQHHQQQQQQQQQQRVIMLDNHCQPATVVATTSPVSMTGAIILACFVTWFCAYVCGLMALRMALAGRRLAEVGETFRAIRLRKASYCFSITGIVFGLTIVIVLVCVLTTSKSTSSGNSSSSHYPNYPHYNVHIPEWRK